MKNTIDAKVSFSFKGEEYNPSMTIDLDEVMKTSEGLPNLYSVLARKNEIDTYSYLYEVMEASDLVFENPKGLAEECVSGNEFDINKFEVLWRNHLEQAKLQSIAKKHMGIDDPELQPGLMAALMEAYQAGKKEA